MEKIVVEVGSTVVKASKVKENKINKLTGKTIEFKKHYMENNTLNENDIQELIEYVNQLKQISSEIYVCGTSIFRELEDKDKKTFLKTFSNATGIEFNIISQEEERDFTVLGATRFIKDNVCVMIGGGGSTEIAVINNGKKECVNIDFGVIDVMKKFPDLAEDFASSDVESVKKYIKEKINLPKLKADVLILAGGEHEKFARVSGIDYKVNTLYNDENAPIMMNIKSRKSETQRYYKEISLDEIRSRVSDPKWWYATRAMCAFVLVVAEAIDAKYVVPTDIAMIYGLI